MIFKGLSTFIFLSVVYNAAALDTTTGNGQPEPKAIASPQKISLQSRTLPKGPRLQRRTALRPISVPLDDFFLGTDLQ